MRDRGFIALMSVILISAILLVLVFTLGVSSFFNRFSTLDREYKRLSLDLAEACANVAMVKIAQDSAYTGGECVGVSDTCGAADAEMVCAICSVSGSGMKTIRSRAVYRGAYTNLRVTSSMASSNFLVASWEEETSGPSGCTVP
jgi:hypothetical protein